MNLSGVLTSLQIAEVVEYSRTRVRESFGFKCTEAVALYEQRYLPDKEIRRLCEEECGCKLYEPMPNFIPEDIIELFRETEALPVLYYPMTQQIVAVYLPEKGYKPFEGIYYNIEYRPTTLHYFLKYYQAYYGKHPALYEVPEAMIFSIIAQEAIALQAADLTISSCRNNLDIYYNIRKKKVKSKRLFSGECIEGIIRYLCIQSPYDFGSRSPKYVDVDINKDYRARVSITARYLGYVITVRLLPNRAFNARIEELNLSGDAQNFLINTFLDRRPGLRLIIGETMSGKNTTALALLKILVDRDIFKVVSVEMPVEQELPGVEQINTETLTEYSENIKSLIHQNPDFVYITEIRDATGLDTVQITNTGKCVMSTLHANSIADTISRLTDITGLSIDRVIQSLHSIVFQQLVRDDETDTVRPVNRWLCFTEDLKYRMYGKSLGEIIKIIREEEQGDVFTA